MNISCNSWVNDSSIFCTAVVTEVSEYPTTNTMGGSQNPNLSYYPFVAYITPEDGKGLTNGAYVDISLTTQGDSDSLYISQMYVKKEDNRYFVYAKISRLVFLKSAMSRLERVCMAAITRSNQD